MKLSEITPGTDYAVNEHGGMYRYEAVQVADHTRVVYSSARWDFNGHKSTAKMVEMRRLRSSDGQPVPPSEFQPETEWFLPRQIECVWATYAAAQERTAAAEQAKASRAARLQQALREVLNDEHVYVGSDGTVTLRGENADKLTAILLEHLERQR